ncbi:MAG: MFS transporter [Candidatus Aenigmatarchaeota archaeon]
MEKRIYLLEALLDISSQFIVPFITLYALNLGFSYFFIGSFNAILNFSYILAFFISLLLISPKIIKNVFSISLLIWGLSFVFIYYSKTEFLFLISILLRAISSSIISVCYTWLISNIFKKKTFEKVSNLAIIYTFITLIATITSSLLIRELNYPSFIFYIPLIFSIFSIYILQKIEIKEKDKVKFPKNYFNFIKNKIKSNIKNEKLKNYSLSLLLFYFSIGIAGPFFSVFLKNILGLSEVEWAIIICIEMVSFLIFSNSIKKLKKHFNITTLFQISTFLISLIPFIWIVTKNFLIIILYSFIAGISWQLFSILHLTYISRNFNVANKISFLNIFIGLGLLLGNIFGGIIAQIKLEYVFYISFIFRFFSSFIFSKLLEGKQISIDSIYKTVFLFLDFFSTLFKEFVIQFKSLDLYNHKKNIHKS